MNEVSETNTNIPNSTIKMPSIPSGSPMLGKSLNLGKMTSRKEQKEYLKKRNIIPIHILALKYISIIFLFLICGIFFWLKADLDPENRYLRLTGLQENTYQEHNTLSSKNKSLKDINEKSKKEIKRIEEKIKNKEFFEFQEEIDEIYENQNIQWFDKIDPDTGELTLGVFDSFEKIKNFFNDKNYYDISHAEGEISGRQILSRNEIEIENIVIDRTHASFSVKSSNVFGKVFFLSTEFVEMMNSFKFFKDGKLETYSRQKIKGSNGMSFTINLKIQEKDEEDPNDVKFQEYEDWLESSKIINELYEDSTEDKTSNSGSKRPRRRR